MRRENNSKDRINMKCYFVWVGDPGYDWGDFVHGVSASKAKAMFWKIWSYEAEDYTWLRPIRVPELDNIPITEENIIKYLRDEEVLYEGESIDEWIPECKCSLCCGK